MLNIGESQLRAFSALRIEKFVQQMLLHLNANFADEIEHHKLDDSLLEQWVRYGIDLGRYYAIHGKQDLTLFIECMLMFTATFDRDPESPWAGQILNRQDITGTQKMDLIHDYVLFATDKGR